MTQLSLSAIAFRHNDRLWEAVRIGGSWFARDDAGNDTGPYPTADDAIDWVKAILPTPAHASRSDVTASEGEVSPGTNS